MPVVIQLSTDNQVRAVKETMATEIRSLLVTVDDTRKTATFRMDNPMRWMQEHMENYDREKASRRVMLILLRKIREAQESKP